jgi:hypothetical protein
MSRFLISGCPRSGTSQFCKTLSKHRDINLWSDGSEYWFEPFSRPSMIFDEAAWASDFFRKNKSKFVGFKKFNNDALSASEMANLFGMKTIAVLRKDIVSVYLSLAIIPLKDKARNNGKGIYGHSSFDMNLDLETILSEVGGFRRLKKNAFWLLKQYHLWENTPTLQKVYFEDMMNGVEYPKLNDFFGKRITFDLDGYRHKGYESYTKDWEKLLPPLAEQLYHAKKSDLFPDYINKIAI